MLRVYYSFPFLVIQLHCNGTSISLSGSTEQKPPSKPTMFLLFKFTFLRLWWRRRRLRNFFLLLRDSFRPNIRFLFLLIKRADCGLDIFVVEDFFLFG
jgi:hypothetical protein